jgi:hypothetical protein
MLLASCERANFGEQHYYNAPPAGQVFSRGTCSALEFQHEKLPAALLCLYTREVVSEREGKAKWQMLFGMLLCMFCVPAMLMDYDR